MELFEIGHYVVQNWSFVSQNDIVIVALNMTGSFYKIFLVTYLPTILYEYLEPSSELNI